MKTTLQTEFFKYHDSIKLLNTDENQLLREKRDLLINELREYFDKKAKNEGKAKITFSVENQGSYSMGTGVKPINGDYDIDVMVLFNFSKEDYLPVQVKKWVFEALDKQFRTVEYKKPCVRVQYHKAGETFFHVDLALYASGDLTKTYLSVGKPTSAAEDKKWEVSNPKRLKERINSKFSDTDDKLQMKRVIRYLKRWKDLKFTNTEYGRPTGIAFTALAYNLFTPEIDRIPFNSSVAPRDLAALKNLVSAIIEQFGWFSSAISVKLPVEPYNDLFQKMTENQRKTFKEKLEVLKSSLEDAEKEPDPHEASKILRRQLGDDFPEVPKEESGQKRSLAFPGKSESA